MASKYIVKVLYESTLRRLALGEADLDFSKLESRTRDLFQIAPTASLRLTYTDKDGDIVTMAGDQDLNDALVLQAINPLRLSVTVTGPQKSSPVAQPTKSGGPMLDSVAGTQKSSPIAQPAQSGGGGSILDRFFSNLARASSVLEEKPKNEEGETLGVKRKTEEAIGTDVARFFAALKEKPKTEEGESADVKPKTEEAIGEGAGIQSKTEEVSGESVEAVSKETDSVVEESPATVDAAEQAAPTLTDTKVPEGSAAEEEIHFGISCDKCDKVPIKGARYKSIANFNYDLCQPCFESSGSAPEDYVKVKRSVNSFQPFPFVPPGRFGLRQMRRPGPQCTKNSCGGVPCDPKADSDPKVLPCAPDVDAATIPAAGQSSEREEKVVKHRGVKCDGCGMSPLIGPRLISRTKRNYDLCSGCFDKSGADADQFHRVEEPENPFLPGRLLLSPFGQYVWIGKEESDSETEQLEEGEEATTEVSRPAEPEANVQTDSVEQGEVAESKAEASDVSVAQEAVKEEFLDAKDVAGKEVNVADEAEVAAEAGTGIESVQNVPVAAPEDDLSTQEGLLAKLSAMGFTDQKLNADILAKNMFDLRKTLDDLCTAEDWSSILEDLQEMGFYDAALNRSLMFKFTGNVKLAVKELVQMSKAVGTVKGAKQE